MYRIKMGFLHGQFYVVHFNYGKQHIMRLKKGKFYEKISKQNIVSHVAWHY